MKNQIIKSYTNWLLESLSLNEEFDQETIQQLVKAQDLDKLYELLVATDDDATKALPNYQAIIDWWKRGSADLNVLQRFIKTGTAAKLDKLNSANSMYYWMGGQVGAGGTGSADIKFAVNQMANLESLLKELETTSATISKIVLSPSGTSGSSGTSGLKNQFGLDVNGVTKLTALIAHWKNVPAIVTEIQTFIDLIKSKGLILKNGKVGKIIPINYTINGLGSVNDQSMPYDQYFKYYADALTADGKFKAQESSLFYAINNNLNLDIVKKGIADATAALNSTKTVSDYFIARSTMSFDNKKAIMEAFNAKINEYVTKNNKVKITAADAINLATNLSILPNGSTITVQPPATPEIPVVHQFAGSYPATESGGDQVQKAINYFKDDQIEIELAIQIELMAAVKSTVASIIADGGKITAVRVSGEASTSIVPSSYDKATKKPTNKPADYSTQNNVDLVTDRLTAIKDILTTAFKAAGVEEALIQPYPNNDNPLPNNKTPGDVYEPSKYSNRKTNPQQQVAYEEAFGKWRFAIGSWEIDVSASSTEPQLIVPISTTSSAWNISISWTNESIKIPRKWKNTLITFFNFKRPPGGAPKLKSGVTCDKRMRLTR